VYPQAAGRANLSLASFDAARPVGVAGVPKRKVQGLPTRSKERGP